MYHIHRLVKEINRNNSKPLPAPVALYDPDGVVVTEEFMQVLRSCPSRQMLKIIGVSWPPRSGWLKQMKGRKISKDIYGRCLKCAESRADMRKDNPKSSKFYAHQIARIENLTAAKANETIDKEFESRLAREN